MNNIDKKCNPFSHPNFAGNYWSCCGCNTMNGDHRDTCKACSHPRCDAPVVKKIVIREANGIRIIPIHVTDEKTRN